MTDTKLRPGKIRDFFTGLPAACGVPKEVAELYAHHLGGVFDLEKKDPGSVFARKPGQTVAERMAPAFDGWIRYASNMDAVEYARDLAVYVAKVDLYNRKGEGNLAELEEDAAYLAADEPMYPEISALLTVADAGIQSNWD